ncbi:protein kinase 1 [Reticulomyxa filosa]|uniref:Protein kinase 1 n=1 Tax=Reticulomyxa filosa TaxID=46433 RepID=X6NSQ6_RETFI|nr:protein kinase 1 [Reticulomyxa filosa]|eukprot:ETO29031.1 protein kinase 1 [Reticulomyxa filosa]
MITSQIKDALEQIVVLKLFKLDFSVPEVRTGAGEKKKEKKEMAVVDTQSLTYGDTDESDPVWARLMPTSKTYQVIELYTDETKFGRAKGDVDHEITEPQVSSLHCIIHRVTDDKNAMYCRVTDCSTNGTFINTNKIGKGSQSNLFDGDELIFIQESRKDAKNRATTRYTFILFYLFYFRRNKEYMY